MIGLFIGLVLMGAGGVALVIGASSKDDAAPMAFIVAFPFLAAGFLVLAASKASNTPAALANARQRNARATIAAATATAIAGTAESELRALERAAATAAAASAASEGVNHAKP